MLQRIKHIWNRVLTHRSEVTCIYLFQLIYGVVIGCISYFTLDDYIGQSMALDRLLSGFDRSVFMDLIHNNSGAISPIVTSGIVLIPIYLLFSIILQGGLLHNIRIGEKGIKTQIRNGVHYLIPFFGYVCISVLIILVFSFGIGLLYKSIVGDPLMSFSSEKPFIHSLLLIVFIISIIVILTWGWSVVARYKYIESGSFWTSIRSGIIFIKRYFIKTLLIGYLLIGLHLSLAYIYFLVVRDSGASSWTIVGIGIIAQQVFSWMRVIIRSIGYISLDQIEDTFIG